MKNRTKISLIFALSAVLIVAGVCTAYYNTKTFGFDADAKLISKNGTSLTVLDFEMEFADADYYLEKIEKIFPDEPISVSARKPSEMKHIYIM